MDPAAQGLQQLRGGCEFQQRVDVGVYVCEFCGEGEGRVGTHGGLVYFRSPWFTWGWGMKSFGRTIGGCVILPDWESGGRGGRGEVWGNADVVCAAAGVACSLWG